MVKPIRGSAKYRNRSDMVPFGSSIPYYELSAIITIFAERAVAKRLTAYSLPSTSFSPWGFICDLLGATISYPRICQWRSGRRLEQS